eukprot:3856219-Pyramimonas_sp.AAC.1
MSLRLSAAPPTDQLGTFTVSLRLSAAPPTVQLGRLHRSLMSARPVTCPGRIGSSERPRIEWFSLL